MFHKFEFTKSWRKPADFPAVETDETKIRDDLQLLHDESRDALWALIEALAASTAAEHIGVTGETGADTLQNVLDALLERAVGNTADRLTYSRTIDGIGFNGSANVCRFCECGTIGNEPAKTASVKAGAFGVNMLQTGARVTVRFEYGNTVPDPTLNINGSGAKPIYYRGQPLPETQYWMAGTVLDFICYADRWEMIGMAR